MTRDERKGTTMRINVRRHRPALLLSVAALCLAAPVHAEPDADATEQAAAGTYRAAFDNGETRTWHIRPGCTMNVTPCITVTQDGPTDWSTGPTQEAQMRYQNGTWWFFQIPRSSAVPEGNEWVTSSTDYRWDPSTLAGQVDDNLTGPGNARARAHRTDRVGTFTLSKIG